MITQSFPMDQALGLDKTLRVDLRTLNWIGNMSDTNEFFFTAKNSATKTLDELLGQSDYFFKCTGKIFCRNFAAIWDLIARNNIASIFWKFKV